MEYFVSLKDKFSVCITEPLTSYKQKLFVDLFQPILSNDASSLYQTLNGLVNIGSSESKEIEHQTILKTLKMNTVDSFLTARYELEALGLIDTYVYNNSNDSNLYVYVVKKLPTAWEYFNDDCLSSMLLSVKGNDDYYELAGAYLAHRFDLAKFKKITKSVDDLYIVSRCEEHLSNWWVDGSFSEVKVNNPHFDYEYFLVLVGSRSVVNQEVLDSVELYKHVNRIAWLFNLTTEELADATISATTNGIVDFEELRSYVKKQYSTKFENVKFVVNTKNEETSNNKLVNTLNAITPSQLVENKYNTKLTASEIEIFDKLLTETNISVGILNVLIIYVMDTKNGEIPSYNYFLKIINTWIRKGVKSTVDALNLITTPNTKNKTKNVPTWYQDYLQKEVDKKKPESSEETSETLDDLEEFFNNKKE